MLQLRIRAQVPLGVLRRLQIIRTTSGCRGRPDDYGDQDFSVGVRHALELTSRFAWFWSSRTGETIKQVAPGTNATHSTVDRSHLLF